MGEKIMIDTPTASEANNLKWLPNGAHCLAIFQGPHSGVVLATWKDEYITWVFQGQDLSTTESGNYFMYDPTRPNEKFDKYRRAVKDFESRVSYTLDNPRHL
tara:strand:+ start:612 stop:917 length:306 start_codon:yes stop_codon:yes gene_type:complete